MKAPEFWNMFYNRSFEEPIRIYGTHLWDTQRSGLYYSHDFDLYSHNNLYNTSFNVWT